MELVVHQAIGEETRGNPLAGVAQALDKGIEVAILLENGLAAVAPVEDRVAEAALGRACGAKHGVNDPPPRSWREHEKSDMPFSGFSCLHRP